MNDEDLDAKAEAEFAEYIQQCGTQTSPSYGTSVIQLPRKVYIVNEFNDYGSNEVIGAFVNRLDAEHAKLELERNPRHQYATFGYEIIETNLK